MYASKALHLGYKRYGNYPGGHVWKPLKNSGWCLSKLNSFLSVGALKFRLGNSQEKLIYTWSFKEPFHNHLNFECPGAYNPFPFSFTPSILVVNAFPALLPLSFYHWVTLPPVLSLMSGILFAFSMWISLISGTYSLWDSPEFIQQENLYNSM